MARVGSTLGDQGPRSGGIRILVVLVAVSLVMVTLYFREGSTGPVHLLRSAAQVVSTPFTLLGAQIVRPFEALGNAIDNLTARPQTLDELEARNAELENQLVQLSEYQLENARLESMLQLVSAYGMSGEAARVIGYSTDDWSDTITIDKGSASGVKVDMPVTNGSGVLGQVVSVSAASSIVRLITDPQQGVSAMLQTSRATGILTGSVDGTLRLQYVDSSVEVGVGDAVITSGLGGVYPKGLLLGVVTSVTTNPSDLYHEITVDPSAVTGNYEEVFVVKSFDPAVADATADAQAGGDTQGDAGEQAVAEDADAQADAGDTDAQAGEADEAAALDEQQAGEGEAL